MCRYLIALSATVLLLTGCSSTSSNPNYDEVELIHYQACINNFMTMTPNIGSYQIAPDKTKGAIGVCSELMPIKK
jgi:uncharacterized protein YcfL